VTQPSEQEAPPLASLYGSVPDLTRGMDSVEWVRRYREGYDAGLAAGLAEAVKVVDTVLDGYATAYPTDVWPDTPFSDAQAASVMRLMVPRIRAAIDAARGADK